MDTILRDRKWLLQLETQAREVVPSSIRDTILGDRKCTRSKQVCSTTPQPRSSMMDIILRERNVPAPKTVCSCSTTPQPPSSKMAAAARNAGLAGPSHFDQG